jgi:uncharacterized protein with PQ loop repeat
MKDVDRLMLVVAVVHPLMAVPQVYTIFHNQSSQNVSLLTWSMFTALGTISLTYAVIHRIRPYIITQILWTVVDVFIISGILLYN